MATQATTSASPDRAGVQHPHSRLPNWAYPTLVVVILGAFSVYGLWVTFLGGANVFPSPDNPEYLSPFNSPLIQISHLPPALLIAWIPASFRLTCYYYRKAYYRSFFGRPRSCAVAGEGNRNYAGETIFPWFLNNFHRFAFYVTAIQVVVLWYDALRAFDLGGHFGIGLGTAIMLLNVILLSGYTFGCHAFRHLAGGNLDCYTCTATARARFQLWKGVTVLNVRHDRWAWASLFSVLAVDVYIRLLSAHLFADPRWIFGQ